jgi:hypothetical protein
MAGTPKKRARQMAAAAIERAAEELTAQAVPPAEVPEAAVVPQSRTPTRARARGQQYVQPLRTPPPLRQPTGNATRSAVDKSTVDIMNQLAKHIRPGLTVRIERIRPHWCAGWIEDYPLDSPDTLGVFYQYLRDEHGGQFYRLTVLGTGEQQLYQTQVPISGRPCEAGRVIDRAVYEGHDQRERNTRAVQAPAPAPSSGGIDAVALLTLFLSQMEKTSTAQLDSVKQMVDSSRQQTGDLAAAVLQVRSESAPRSLKEQLGEVLEATQAVEEVKRALGGTTKRAGAAADDDDDEWRVLKREATKGFIQNVMGSLGQKRSDGSVGQPQTGPKPAGPVGNLRRVDQQNRKVVLDAVPVSGQQHGKN